MKTDSDNPTCAYIRKHVRCGCCGGKIGTSINMVALGYKAKWKYPTSGNVLTGESGEAVAICCDSCVNRAATVVEAVEFKGGKVVYHPLAELEVYRK